MNIGKVTAPKETLEALGLPSQDEPKAIQKEFKAHVDAMTGSEIMEALTDEGLDPEAIVKKALDESGDPELFAMFCKAGLSEDAKEIADRVVEIANEMNPQTGNLIAGLMTAAMVISVSMAVEMGDTAETAAHACRTAFLAAEANGLMSHAVTVRTEAAVKEED